MLTYGFPQQEAREGRNKPGGADPHRKTAEGLPQTFAPRTAQVRLEEGASRQGPMIRTQSALCSQGQPGVPLPHRLINTPVFWQHWWCVGWEVQPSHPALALTSLSLEARSAGYKVSFLGGACSGPQNWNCIGFCLRHKLSVNYYLC